MRPFRQFSYLSSSQGHYSARRPTYSGAYVNRYGFRSAYQGRNQPVQADVAVRSKTQLDVIRQS